jgi:hypothetical protein
MNGRVLTFQKTGFKRVACSKTKLKWMAHKTGSYRSSVVMLANYQTGWVRSTEQVSGEQVTAVFLVRLY